MIAAGQNDAVAVTRVMCVFQRSSGVPARSTRRGAARVGGTLRGGTAAYLDDVVQESDSGQQRRGAPLPRKSTVCSWLLGQRDRVAWLEWAAIVTRACGRLEASRCPERQPRASASMRCWQWSRGRRTRCSWGRRSTRSDLSLFCISQFEGVNTGGGQCRGKARGNEHAQVRSFINAQPEIRLLDRGRTRRVDVDWTTMAEELCTQSTLRVYVSASEFDGAVPSRLSGETAQTEERQVDRWGDRDREDGRVAKQWSRGSACVQRVGC